MRAPLYSVVIPTYNRLESLLKVMYGLATQSCSSALFEAVVVSDGSTDGTVARLQSATFPFRVIVLEQANAGPAAARNLGVAKAKGSLIIFLDDDVVPAADFILEHARSHHDRTDTVVIGPMLPAPDPTSPWVDWETAILEKQYRHVESGVWDATARQFFTGNASVQRRRVLAAGGFDTSLRRSEDVELAFRLQKLGVRFVFNRRAAGTHIAERSFESWLKSAYQYGRNDIAIGYRRKRRDLLESVAAEFHQRHALTRLLVWAGLKSRWVRRSAVSRMSRLVIGAAFKLRLRGLARYACSGVFNLFYWFGISDELGSADAGLSLIRSDPSAAPAIVGHALASRAAPPTFQSPPDVSVVVCTRDRPESLKNALASILLHFPEGSELIVVDQGRDDSVSSIIEDLAAPEGLVRYVRCRRLGLSGARNDGASHAANPVLVFTDDDCIVGPDWVNAWKGAFTAPGTAVMGFGEVATAQHDPAQGFIPGFELVPGLYGPELFKKGIGAVGMGANMAVRRDAWEALGGFDESLGSGRKLAAAEDTDFAFRAVRAGYLVMHTGATPVVHHGFRPKGEASRLVAGYMGGIAAMYLKHARCGDGFAVELFLREGAGLFRNVLLRLASRQRPLGARSLAAYLRVGMASMRLPIDTRLRVFASLRIGTAS